MIADYKILGQKISYLKELPYVVYLMHKIDLLQFFFFLMQKSVCLVRWKVKKLLLLLVDDKNEKVKNLEKF